VYALADVQRRAKLRQICLSMSRKPWMLSEVRSGIFGPTMGEVAELLTAFGD